MRLQVERWEVEQSRKEKQSDNHIEIRDKKGQITENFQREANFSFSYTVIGKQ